MITLQRATVKCSFTIPELHPRPARTDTHRPPSASNGGLAGWQEARLQNPAISPDAEAPDRTRIDDRKQAEKRLRQENTALREEIDETSMFEQIVGTSSALRAVLSRIAKVAPSDSTVLITGETGTGKELIARAVHKRCRRAGRAFVS